MNVHGQSPVRRRALRVSLAYAFASLLWIASSDRLVAMLLSDPERIATVSTFKGAMFVLVTSCLLYLLLSRPLPGRQAADTDAEPDSASRRFPFWPPLLVFAGSTSAILVLGAVTLGAWSAGGGSLETLEFIVTSYVALLVLVAAVATELWWKVVRTRVLLRESRAQAEHLALEKRLHDLLQYANDAIFLIGAGGRLVDVNDRAVELHGYSREELLGMSLRQLLAPEVRNVFEADFDEVSRLGRALFETIHLKKDGTTFPVEVSTRVLEVDGEIFHQGIVRDISERRRAEQQIARLTSLNTALGQINQAIVRTADRGTLLSEICRIAVDLGRFRFAWVGMVDQETARVPVTAKGGNDEGYLDRIYVTVDPDDPRSHGPVGTAIGEGRACVIQDFLEDPRTLPWREAARRVGVRSAAAFPLKTLGRPVGALTVYASEVGFFDEKSLQLMGEIADDVSYALENLDREDRRREAEEALRRSEEQLRESQRIAGLGRYDLDVTSGAWTSSEILDQIFGIGPDHTHDVAAWTALLHPDDRDVMVRYFTEEVLGKGLRFEREYRIVRHGDGDVRWVLGLGELFRDAEGRVVRMVGTIQDVTERRRSEERYRLWSQVLESSAEGIMVTDAHGTIVTVNPAFTELTGYAAEEAVGATPEILESGRHGPEFDRAMWAAVRETGRWQGEVWSRRKSGEVYPEWLSITAVKGAGGELTHHIAIFSDITERKRSADRIQYLATHDFLTGLPNRSLVGDLLRQAVANARRKGGRVGVLFLDLDRFKTINDSLGHLAGDALLQGVAERLLSCLRAGDTVSRLGGDEFLILLPEIERSQDVAQVADKILEAMQAPFALTEGEVNISPSIGIAIHPDDGEDGTTLVRNADAAMYHAKERGRNNRQFFTPDMNARAFEALAVETSLRRAVERQEFLLVYQPQVRLEDGRITGAEALVRWRHPEMGLVLPGTFIPIAEEHGLIVPIGEWVLRTACRQVRAWLDAGLPAVPVAVNVSALQFRSEDFAPRLRRILAETGLAPRYLELELTESIVMREAEASIGVLAELKEMGVRFAIDDFGTGFSSLSYLGRLPIDRLKIDRSFIRDVSTSPSARAITSAIVGMARSLGLRVIAEGVETPAQLEFLRAQACDEVQGYLASYPLDAADLATILSTGRSLLAPGAAGIEALPRHPSV